MINGMHAIVYSKNAEQTRTFLRDVLNLPHVDAGRGWLIFALPPAEIAAHPDESGHRHELYLMCDDIHETVSELRSKGVRIPGEIRDEGWGLLVNIDVPGAGEMGLYQPRHPVAVDLRR
jgi:hypothetical protein